jgi:uncharacterized membrane protein
MNANDTEVDVAHRGAPDEHVMEWWIGRLLQVGVFLAAAVVLVGGIAYLITHTGPAPDYSVFRGEPASLTSAVGVVQDAFSLSSRGVIQLGVLLLVATPIARVIFSLFTFLWERDWTYVVVTMIVLAVLLYALAFERF